MKADSRDCSAETQRRGFPVGHWQGAAGESIGRGRRSDFHYRPWRPHRLGQRSVQRTQRIFRAGSARANTEFPEIRKARCVVLSGPLANHTCRARLARRSGRAQQGWCPLHGGGSDHAAAVRKSPDAVARRSGDEFAILQTGLNDRQAALSLAHKLLESIAQPFVLEGRKVHTGVSRRHHPAGPVPPPRPREAATGRQGLRTFSTRPVAGS